MDNSAKKRVLLVNEFSGLNTGFSVIGMEVLSHLYKTGKYEVAELATYTEPGDPKHFGMPWKIYPGVPPQSDKSATEFYQNNYIGQFGAAVFDNVCLDFKPDIVIAWLDPFMINYIDESPFRDKFKLMVMACVDSSPQRPEWGDFYSRADYLLGYARYTKEVLESEFPDKIKIHHLVRPGVNTDVYKKLNKKQCRKELNVPEDANIILTVMRNQRRKLFPDLIEAFAEYLDRTNSTNTYLYLHTSYPDVGFDIGRHIMQNGVSHRILVSYVCAACGNCYADFFQTEVTNCKICNRLAAHMPNTSRGVTREQLAKIHNTADLYIQYSICEGLGMPICEAKACEVPVLAVDYSAMSEQVEIPGCDKIKVAAKFHEPILETEQVRALPDKNDCVEKIIEFFKTTPELREKFGKLAREDVVDNYSFDRAVRIFEAAIDEAEILDRNKTWYNMKPKLPPMSRDIPDIRSDYEFVGWCLENVLGRKDLVNSFWHVDTAKALAVGYKSEKGGRVQMDRERCFNSLMHRAITKRKWEMTRLQSLTKGEEKGIPWILI